MNIFLKTETLNNMKTTLLALNASLNITSCAGSGWIVFCVLFVVILKIFTYSGYWSV